MRNQNIILFKQYIIILAQDQNNNTNVSQVEDINLKQSMLKFSNEENRILSNKNNIMKDDVTYNNGYSENNPGGNKLKKDCIDINKEIK